MDDTIDRILEGMGFAPRHDEDLRQLAPQFTAGNASSVLAYS